MGEVKTEQPFDGKLCQKYLYQNYQNLIIGFQVTVENVGDGFWNTVLFVSTQCPQKTSPTFSTVT